MSKIKLDDKFRIELTNTYDLVEHLGKRLVETGEEIELVKYHGYHSNLKKALCRYSEIMLQREGKTFTINEYIDRLNEIYNSVKEDN